VRGLSRNRLRTFFMMLGTFVGVCALTVILAIGQGTQREVQMRVEQMLGGSTVFLRAGGGQIRAAAHGPPATTLTLEDLRALRKAIPSIEYVDPFYMVGADVVYGATNRRIRLSGHAETAELVWNRAVTRGAWFTASDVASAARVALIGEVVAHELFGERNPLGEQIRIGTVPLQVIGVLEHAGIDPHGMDQDNEIIIPITTMMRRVLNVDHVLGAKLALRAGTDLDNVVVEITDVMRGRHAIGENQPADFALFTPTQVRERVTETNRVFTLFLPLAAGVSIVIGGLVVANLMLMNVQERKAEIGLRKAIGARPRDIRLQFLAESVAVTALGGLLALAVGFGVLQLLARISNTPRELPWTTALLGLACAVAVGSAAGVAPARRAAGLDAAQAIR
jgi:putative ABC transport system permease protein